MSDVYTKIVECLNNNDVQCLASLADTPEFKYILSELEKKGFSKEDIVSAIAAGNLEAVDLFRNTTIGVATKINTLAGLVNEKKYVEVLEYVVNNPDVVKAISVLTGSEKDIGSYISGFVYLALSNDLKSLQKIRDIVSKDSNYVDYYIDGFRSYLLIHINNLCDNGMFEEAVKTIRDLMSIATSSSERNVLHDAVVLLIGKFSVTQKPSEPILEAGKEFGYYIDVSSAYDWLANEILTIAKELGVVTENHERETVKDAESVLEVMTSSFIESLFNEISEAMKKEDVNNIKTLVNSYADLLSKIPLTVKVEGTNDIATVEGIDMYRYLTSIATYIELLKPSFKNISEAMNSAMNAREPRQLLSIARIITDNVTVLERNIDTLALIRYVSSISTGKKISLNDARKEAENDLEFYRLNARYLETVALINSLCNDKSCDVSRTLREIERLREFFNYFPESKDMYCIYKLSLSANINDVAGLLGIAKDTSLSSEIKSLGITPRTLYENKSYRDAMEKVLVRVVSEALSSADEASVNLAKLVVQVAVQMGFNGTLRSLYESYIVLEKLTKNLVEVNSIAGEMGKEDAKFEELAPRYISAIEKAVQDMSKDLRMFGNSLASMKVKVGDTETTLHSYITGIIDSLTFSAKVVSLYLDLTKSLNKLQENLQNSSSFGEMYSNISQIINEINKYRSAITSLGSTHRQPVDQFINNLDSMTEYYKEMQNIVEKAITIDGHIKAMLDLLQDGFQHPSDTQAVYRNWRNALVHLSTLKFIATDPKSYVRAKFKQNSEPIINLSSRIYESIYRYLSELKNGLVKNDVRLEEVLNKAEADSGTGISIPYEKPYLQVPVIGELEKWVKVFLTQAKDIFSNTFPVVGELGRIIHGLADAATSLLRPYEAWQQVLAFIEGAKTFADHIKNRRYREALRTIYVPVVESFLQDPYGFVGRIIGFAFLASVGKSIANAIANKLKMPGIVKLDALITNLLQADPLGLFIDYIVSPAFKIGISKMFSLWKISPTAVASLVVKFCGMPITSKIAKSVSDRIQVLAKNMASLALFIGKWGDDISKVYNDVQSIMSKKGVNYLLALRNRLIELDNNFKARFSNVIAMIRRFQPNIELLREKPFLVLGLGSQADIDTARRAVQNLQSAIGRLSSVLGIKIDINDLAGLRIKDLIDIKNKIIDAVDDIRSKIDSFNRAIDEVVEHIRRSYPNIYTEYKDVIDRALMYRSYDPFSSLKQLTDIIADLVHKYRYDIAIDIGSNVSSTLVKYGMQSLADDFINIISKLGISDQLVTAVRQFSKLANDMIPQMRRHFNEYVLSGIAKIEDLKKYLPDLDQISKILSESDGISISGVLKAFGDLADALENIIKVTTNIDVLNMAKKFLEQVASDIESLKKSVKELALDNYDFIRKEMASLDEALEVIKKRLGIIDSAYMKLMDEVKTIYQVAEIAKALGLDEVAVRILKERMSVEDATKLVMDSMAIKSFDDLIKAYNTILEFIKKVESSPQTMALRKFLTTIQVKLEAIVDNSPVPDNVYKAIDEFGSKHSTILPVSVQKAIEEFRSKPTISTAIRVVKAVSDFLAKLDPLKAAEIDLALTKQIIDLVEDTLKRVSDPKLQIPNVKAYLDALDEADNVLTKVKSLEVKVSLVDPALKKALDIASDELKKSLKPLSKTIDSTIATLKKFVELVENNKFSEAAKMASEARSAATTLWRLGLLKSVKDGLINLFKDIVSRLTKSFGDNAPDEVKAVSAVANDVKGFLEKTGTIDIRKSGYGFLATRIDDVVGFTIKAPLDMIDELVEILSIPRKEYTINLAGRAIKFVREVDRTPFELKIRYTISTVNGNAYIEMTVKTVEFNANTKYGVNAVNINIWYDPPLHGSEIAKEIAKEMSNGLDFLRKIDPDVEMLAKVVTWTPIEVSFGSILSNAVKYLGLALTAAWSTLDAINTNQTLKYIVSQAGINTVINSIPSLAPVSQEILDVLAKYGYLPRGQSGKIVMVDILNPNPLIPGFLSVRTPDGGKVILPYIPKLDLVLVPVPTPIYKPDDKPIETPKDLPSIKDVDLNDLLPKYVPTPEPKPEEEEKVVVKPTPTPTPKPIPPTPIPTPTPGDGGSGFRRRVSTDRLATTKYNIMYSGSITIGGGKTTAEIIQI